LQAWKIPIIKFVPDKESNMARLITTYQQTPTLANAQRIRAYERKHPMCMVMLDREQADVVADAIHHANRDA